jgi:uncharacterized protein YjbJ (UPF0337 family)
VVEEDVIMSNERLKGKAEEIKGNVKQGVGRLIGDEQLEAQGQVDELEGQGSSSRARASRLKVPLRVPWATWWTIPSFRLRATPSSSRARPAKRPISNP